MKRRDLIQALPAWCAAGLSLGTGVAQAAIAKDGVVRFGQSASLSGGQARYGSDVRDGIAAAFAAANKAEGSKGGLRFELVTLDDGGVKDRCVANVKQLIGEGVSALVGLTSGAAAEASLPLVEQAQIPLLGTASGNMGIRNGSPWVCHVRAGYDVEYKRMVTYVRDFGMRRVGYVFLVDTAKANLAAMTKALEQVGVKPAVAVGIDRNAKSLEPVAQQLLDAQLDCAMFTTNAAPILALIELMTRGRYPGMYFSSSFAGQELIDKVPATNRSVVMSLVVPRPSALGVGVVSQARNDLAAHGGVKLGVTTLEGYIVGRVAVEAARRAARGGSPDRQRVRDSLASLQADLGGYRVSYAPDNRLGSQYVEMVVVDRYGRIVG